MKLVNSIPEFFALTRGGRPVQSNMSVYDGKTYKCGCGKNHEFFWKEGEHLKSISYSPMATYVDRELKGMKFVFTFTTCKYHNLVKITLLGGLKTIATVCHDETRIINQDYKNQFFERNNIIEKNSKARKPEFSSNNTKVKKIIEINTKARKPEFSSNNTKVKKIIEINTKARKPEFSSNSTQVTKKISKKKNVKTKVVKKEETSQDKLDKLFSGKYEKIMKEQDKLNTSFAKKQKNYLDLEKKYLSSQKKLMKSFYKTYSKDFGLSKKETKSEIDFVIEASEVNFKDENKHFYDYIKFLKKIKSDI